MSVFVRNYEYPPGRHWVEVLEPVCDGGGVASEKWSEPLPATFDAEGKVWVDGWESPLVFEWRVVERSALDGGQLRECMSFDEDVLTQMEEPGLSGPKPG